MNRAGEEKIRVLVVDDDEGMVNSLRDILGASGFEVDVAYSGTEALERSREQAPDCVLMDLRMPGLNGVETFRQLKHLAPDSYVIFMTAYAASGLVDDARHEGAVEVIPKPLDLERVIHLIEETTSRTSVLVVGDEAQSESAIGDSLSRTDFEVRFAHSVDEAVLLFDQQPWRAVIVDMEYGGRIGVDGLRVIRDLNPHAEVILLAGLAGLAEETHQALEKIATAYFSRPFSLDDVAERVRQIVVRRRLKQRRPATS